MSYYSNVSYARTTINRSDFLLYTFFDDNLLLETGDNLLLETGDLLVLETSGIGEGFLLQSDDSKLIITQ